MKNNYELEWKRAKEIQDELILNKAIYQELVKPFTDKLPDLLKDNFRFEDEIEKNFDSVVKWAIAAELHKRINVNIDDAFIEIESQDIKEYLK